MAGLIFKSLSDSELIRIADGQFQLTVETPNGRRDIALSDLMTFINAAVLGRIDDVESAIAALGLDPDTERVITVDGDVQGTANLVANNVGLTLTISEEGLPLSKIAGLVDTLMALRMDVDSALDGLDGKLSTTGTAVAADKLAHARTINGTLFDGTQDIIVGLTPEQQEAIGTDKTFPFEQSSAAAIWIITHNLNKFPSVSVVDSAGTQIEGAVTYIDVNNVRIEFAGAMAGTAFLN